MQAKAVEVTIAKGTAVEQLDLQVDAFCKAIAMAAVKIIQDAWLPVADRLDESAPGGQAAGLGAFQPGRQARLGGGPIRVGVKPGAQIFFERIARLQFRREKISRTSKSDIP